MPTGLKVLFALCSRRAKNVFKKTFRILNHLRCAWQVEQLQKSIKSIKKHQALLTVVLILKQRKRFKHYFCWRFCCWTLHLYPKLLFIHTGAVPLLLYPLFFPMTVTPQLALSSCNWPHEGFPVICQSSLDEAQILKGHSTWFYS